MLAVFPAPMNIYLLKKIPSTYNMKFEIFHHVQVEYNIVNMASNVGCILRLCIRRQNCREFPNMLT